MIKDKISNHIHKPISGEWGDDCDGVNCRNVLRTTNFTHLGNVKYDEVVRRTIDESVFQKKRLYKNDIIIEKSGGSDTIAVGRVVFFDLDDDNYTCNNFTSILRCKKTINPKYLHYCLYNNHRLGLTAYYQNKTTGIRNLQLTRYMDTEIPLFPLPQQEKIVSVLDTASALVEKQKNLLKKYDLFLKSKFIEMFGDPILNPMGWEHQAFDKIAHSRLGKMLDEKREINKDKLPYLANYNVQWGKFNLDSLREMSFDTNEKIEFSLKKGDLLICEGGEIGRTAIWKEEIQNCYFSKALHRCRVNSFATAEYILYFMWFMAKNGGLSKHTTSATISHLTGIKLKKILIPIPPIELQSQFAQIVEQTEILKQKEQQKLEKIQTLYDALMQRAFNGKIK